MRLQNLNVKRAHTLYRNGAIARSLFFEFDMSPYGQRRLFFDTITLMAHRNLFNADTSDNTEKEAAPVKKLKNLENKITSAIEKVKNLKEENEQLAQRLRELETAVGQKDKEITRLSSERDSIKDQVEELLGELETLEI